MMEPPSLVMRPALWGWTASRGGVLKSRLRVFPESGDAERVVFGVSAPKYFLPTRYLEVLQKTEKTRQLCTLDNQTRLSTTAYNGHRMAIAVLVVNADRRHRWVPLTGNVVSSGMRRGRVRTV